MALRLLLPLASLLAIVIAQNGYSPNYWGVDIVTPKPDPFDQISSNYGQPVGEYNWNSNQWELMNRSRRVCDGCTEGGKHVAVQNLTIFVNDTEFFIKSVCYVPVPFGIKTGGGLCSERRDPYGQNYSACTGDYYYSDDSPGRVPPGPPGGWFTNVFHRDFPILIQAGANAIRMYYTSPITKQYTENVLNNLTSVIPGEPMPVPPAYGYSHITFLDLAYQYGLMVIYPLYGDQTGVTLDPPDQIEGYIKAQIDEVGNHPAILMYTLGNEWPVSSDDSLRALLNQYIAFARNYSLAKWGRKIPFTHALNDDPFIYDAMYAELDVDVLSTNAGYRGEGFQDLWDGSQTPGFSGLGPLSQQYNKPNFISEIGWIQVNGSQTASLPGWFNYKWKDLILKGTGAGCVGGSFFEYLDEEYTKADPAQQTMGMVAPRVSTSEDALPTTFPTLSVTYPPYYQSTQAQRANTPANTISSVDVTYESEAPSGNYSAAETSSRTVVRLTNTIEIPSSSSPMEVGWFSIAVALVLLLQKY